MSKIRELREKQARIYTEAMSLRDEIKDDTPEDRVAEVDQKFDRMMADFDKLEKDIEREERLQKAGRIVEGNGDGRRPTGDDVEARGEVPPADIDEPPVTYKEAFDLAVRWGVSALNPEQRGVLMTGRIGSEIPPEIRAQATGTDAAGGYIVPEGFSGEIDKAMAAWGPMWEPGVTRELNTASGNKIPWPTVDDTANTGRIKAENASVDDDGTDDVVFGEAELDAYVYDTGMVRVPLEMLQDSFTPMESILTDLFGERMGRLANTTLTTGTGTAQPQGIVTGSTLGKTAASATAITSDEILDTLHSVDPAYRESPMFRWQFNDTTLLAIRKLTDGQGNYLWQMGDIRVGEPNMLLGHPYSVNQAMASPASTTIPILIGDHSRFVVRKVLGFQVMTLRERYAENFQVGMVGFKRFDSVLLNTAAVKHLQMAV